MAANRILPVADEGAVEHFPPLAEFRRMCLEPQRNAAPLRKLGLPDEIVARLQAFFQTYEAQPSLKIPEGTFEKTDQVTYEALAIIVDRAQQRVMRDCKRLVNVVESMTGLHGIELRTVAALEKSHAQLIELLADVYKPGNTKPNPRDVKALIEMPQKRYELVRDIPREVQAIFNNLQQQAMMQQQQQQQQGGRASRR